MSWPTVRALRRMVTRVLSATLVALEAALVRVEGAVASGLPAFTTVGLPGPPCARAPSASARRYGTPGFAFAPDRSMVDLAPAGLRKEGASFDLPVALRIP